MNFRIFLGRKCLLLQTIARLALLCIVWKVELCGVEVRAQGAVTEYDVKAAFLAKFPQFVTWPSSRSSITVGIVGDDRSVCGMVTVTF